MQIRTLDELLRSDRIFIKYGTNAITIAKEGKVPKLNIPKIEEIAGIVNTLYKNGREPVIISSGAVAAGMERLGLIERPEKEELLQLLASLGQANLQTAYQNAFDKYGIYAVQGLLTHDNFNKKSERRNVRRMIELGFEKLYAIVLNTNDFVTNTELVRTDKQFGYTDNDYTGAYSAVCCKKEDGTTSFIIVSENGGLGKGGASGKEKAFLKAENAGILTNIYNPVTHNQLMREVVKKYGPVTVTS